MENTREQKLKYIFGANQDVKEFHVTSDDQAFRSAVDAANHAKTLENQAVKIEKREDYVTVKPLQGAELLTAVKVREALVARHVTLFGNEPAKNAKNETIAKKIEAEEARLAEVGAGDESDGGGISDEEE